MAALRVLMYVKLVASKLLISFAAVAGFGSNNMFLIAHGFRITWSCREDRTGCG